MKQIYGMGEAGGQGLLDVENRTFTVTEATELTIDGTAGEFSTLQMGDFVTVEPKDNVPSVLHVEKPKIL